MKEKYLSIEDVSLRWKLHQETIRRMVSDGKLKSIKFGNRLRISIKEVEKYEQSNET
tara:strand:+ start:9343 stop:9513 length:171 start_codon:yes stop_codon:yes gene_type:complete